MSSQLRKSYDIIINGGGIVGFTLLNLILKSPHLNRFKVLLIEQASRPSNLKQPPRYTGDPANLGGDDPHGQERNFSNRVSSITQRSKLAFKNSSVWDTIKPYTKDVKSIKVWNYDYTDRISFEQIQSSDDSDKEERNVMFSIVENNRLSLALLDNICKHDNGLDRIYWNHTLQHLTGSSDAGLVDVVVKNNQNDEEFIASAPLVLGCDGFKSKVREFSRMMYNEFSLEKTAVVGTVKMSSNSDGRFDENDIAYQRFSPEKDTVAALLPLDREYSSFVISAPNDYSKYLMDCDDDVFTLEFERLLTCSESPNNAILRGLHDMSNLTLDSLHNILQSLPTSMRSTNDYQKVSTEFGGPPRLESVVKNSRATFPLIFGTTTPRMIAPLPGRQQFQLALLGDSSHRVHPLAGQGLNLGIQDALELVEQLEALAKCGERLFDPADLAPIGKVLKRYEFKRQAYIIPMSAGILSMPCLFKLMPSRIVSTVNKCDIIKSASVRIANG